MNNKKNKKIIVSRIVPDDVIKLMKPFNFKSMYELGNKITNGIPYSVFYRKLGIQYISIDINGRNGALKLDLTKPINLKSRDMVSNIGTTEHVINQEAVFRNIHNLSHFRMVHWVPIEKERINHGFYGYNELFFLNLCELNNYEIEKFYKDTDRHLICCSFKKTDDKEFVWDTNRLKIYKNERIENVK